MWSRRLNEILALLMIGDGVVAAIEPRRHLLLWDAGPEPYRDTVHALLERPNLTRALGVAEAAAGIAWALAQSRD